MPPTRFSSAIATDLTDRTPTTHERKAFDQLEKESNKAFAAFSLYLSMGPERSLAAVGQKLGKSVALVERWSAKYGWSSRVMACAAHLAVIEREATEALTRGKAAEWLVRQQSLREEEWELHERCIAAAKRALAAFMERDKVYANLADVARILEVASKLGRMASGLATESVEHTGADGGPIRIEFDAALKKIYGEPMAGEVIDVASAPVWPAAHAAPATNRPD